MKSTSSHGLRIGTSHFVSKVHAVMYYKEYGYDNVKDAVQAKLDRKEIHIGEPKITDKEYLHIDEDGRYIRIEK